ncbi:MAG: stage II sporulation protein P [Bacillota bacterium]
MSRRILATMVLFFVLWICSLSWAKGADMILRIAGPRKIMESCLMPQPDKKPTGASLLLAGAGRFASQVELTKKGLIRSALPVVSAPLAVPAVSSLPPALPEVREAAPSAPPPLVAIYNTHTAETYALTDGVERVKGRGGVFKAAAALGNGLRERGVSVLCSDMIHDASYATSYLESEKTVRAMLYDNPQIDAFFDVHRDSKLPRSMATVDVGGSRVAQVLIVVGSDARQPFPGWRQNLAFAKRIAERADAFYPGLCRGVRVKEGRYNQFLSPRLLVLEIGGVNNTLEEAEAAAALLANVLADVVLEDNDHKKDNSGPPG